MGAADAPGIVPAHKDIQELDACGFCAVAGERGLKENLHIGFCAKQVVTDVASGEMEDNTVLCIGSDNCFLNQVVLPVRNGIRIGDIESLVNQDAVIGLEQAGVFGDPEIKAHKAIEEKRPEEDYKDSNSIEKKQALLFSIPFFHEGPVRM